MRWSREVGNQPRYEETGEAEARGLPQPLSTIDSRSRWLTLSLFSEGASSCQDGSGHLGEQRLRSRRARCVRPGRRGRV